MDTAYRPGLLYALLRIVVWLVIATATASGPRAVRPGKSRLSSNIRASFVAQVVSEVKVRVRWVNLA